MRLKEIGEFGLIERIKAIAGDFSNAFGIGDDCAIIPFCDKELLVSVDALVEGVHFLPQAKPYLLGRKSLAVNISDIAAMAGYPKWAFLSLSVKDGLSVDWVDDFIRGFVDLAEEFGVELLGGDTTNSERTVINVTIIGYNPIGTSIKRSTAKVGDLVCVSGTIGCSYAGLRAIKGNIYVDDALIMKHLDPKPRVKEALHIKSFATAMIDISDGLIQDCGHICKQSLVGMNLFWDRIPFCSVDFVTEYEMICGGEDYELVVCVDRKFVDKLKSDPYFKVIGEVTQGSEVCVLKDGKVVKLVDCGYEHFIGG